jgi:hypothetical protein
MTPETELRDPEVLRKMVRGGASYQEVGHRVGLPPGQVYMIVTGMPADGGDVLTPEELADRGGLLLPGSSQHLVNPPTEVPTHDEKVSAWLRGRAAADEPMREAAARRTAQPPPVAEPEASDDVVTVLGRDHNQIKFLLEQLSAIPGVRQGGSPAQQQQRVSLVDMVRVRASAHEVVEERHLWPTVRRVLPDGAELERRGREQEEEGTRLLARTDGMSGDEDGFDELVERLVAALRAHVAFEDQVFLALREAVPPRDLEQLGRKVRRALHTAPTRAHPHASPFNPFAAPADRLRDAFGRRPADRAGRPEEGTGPAGEP